jgi:hypothetical protein
VTIKTHETLHIVQEDVWNIGDLRNVHCLTGERGNHRMKRQHTNNIDPSYWKAIHYMEECLLKPVTVSQIGDYEVEVLQSMIDVTEFESSIESVTGLKLNSTLLIYNRRSDILNGVNYKKSDFQRNENCSKCFC